MEQMSFQFMLELFILETTESMWRFDEKGLNLQ